MKKMKIILMLCALTMQLFAQDTAKNSGGPDNFGYRWIDSDEVGGPQYSWVEISSIGQILTLYDDSAESGLDLGFSLSFYDSTYTSMTVSSNGFITFTSWDSATNSSIPSASEPNDLIAAFWNDLNPGSQGGVYFYQDTANQRAIVQFDNVPKYGSTDGNTFQVIINSDNSIVIQYKEMLGFLEECTVGIENFAGDDGLQAAYNQAYLKNGLAIKFYSQETVVGGSITVSENSFNYGYVNVGSTVSRSFIISNTSSSEVLEGSIETVSGYTVSNSAKNTLEFRINPTKSSTFDLLFEPAATQTYSGYVVINSSDSENTPDSIYVTGEGATSEISVSVSDTLYANSLPGRATSELFNILNSGNAQLVFTTRAVESAKKAEKGSGGPDSFGYNWKDSDETGGPVYNWIEISGSGTALSPGDDELSVSLPIGFNFPFYGSTFSSVKICSNGFLSFTTTSTLYNNTTIPASSEPNNLIAVFWDDLIPDETGKVYYYSDSVLKRFVVQYNNVLKLNNERSTYQVILYYDGSIVYQYKDMNGAVNECTVGIENSTGTVGSLAAYNTAVVNTTLKDGHAIEFYPPLGQWLSISPSRGTVAGISGSQLMTVGFDAAELGIGKYFGNIYIYSNDPDTPTLTVPVKFNVYELTAPANLTTSVSSGVLTLNWTSVPHATSYKIYSSNTPYGTFVEDTTGTINGTQWTTNIVNAKKFYKVTSYEAK